MTRIRKKQRNPIRFSMSLFLIKIWQFTKTHWQTLVVLIAALIIVWQLRDFFTNRDSNLLKQMEDMKKIYAEEIDAVKKAFDEERLRHNKNVKKLEEDLQASQEKYDQSIQALENKKKINIVKIVKKYGKDPIELAKKVQSVTGFEIVMPETKR